MLTFQELLAGFVESSKAKANYGNYCRFWDQYFRTWIEHPTFVMVEDWHQSVVRAARDEAGNPQWTRATHANKALGFLKAAYTRAIRRGLYSGINPTSGVKEHATNSRERVMDEDEIGRLMHGLEALLVSVAGLPYSQYRAAQQLAALKLVGLLYVLLLTGCRHGEALRMEWAHLDMDSGKWLQPKTKNKKPHTTYVPTQARAMLARIPQTGAFVFMGVYQHAWSPAGVSKPWRRLRNTLRLSDVHLHDFRRTVSTHLYRATKDEYLVKRCINHVNPSVTAIYVRITQEEVAKALQAQADRFFALIAGPVSLALPAPAQEALAPVAFC